MRIPPALRPGDRIDVIAPSSPFDVPLAWRGLGWLSERYDVRFDRGVFAVDAYLAGPDSRRERELVHALLHSDSAAVIAMRGGYGLNRVAHRVDWNQFADHPKWIVGFSDITALHVEAAAAGVASMHGCMVAHLGRGDGRSRDRWTATLEAPERKRVWANLATWVEGAATGPLFGGNLTVLHACAAAGRLRVPDGAVLLLEDVGERPYRIDRALATLLQGGHFKSCSAVVLGEFTDCHPAADGRDVDDVLHELLEPLGVPIVAGMPVGHGLRNDPVVLGARATLTAQRDEGSLEIGGA